MDDIEAAPDRDLVAAVRQGDMSAFETLYRRYSPVVRRVVSGTLRGSDLVDDAVQDVFLKVMEQLPNLRDPDRLQPWLKAIARNVATDVVRVKPTSDIDAVAPDVFVSSETSQGEITELRELVHLVQGAFTQLSPRDLRAVAMVGYLDASTEEIAERLGITPGAAKVVLHRARGRLRNALKLELLVRQGGSACTQFVELAETNDLTAAGRHLASCIQCQQAGSAQIKLYDATTQAQRGMGPSITITSAADSWTMPLVDDVHIGRALEDVSGGQKLLVDGPTVSRHHAELRVATATGEVTLVDTSTNGTTVNGFVVHQDSVRLDDGDVVEIGTTEIVMHAGTRPAVADDIPAGFAVVVSCGLDDPKLADTLLSLRSLLRLYGGALAGGPQTDIVATWDPGETEDAVSLAFTFARDAAAVVRQALHVPATADASGAPKVGWAVTFDDLGGKIARHLATEAQQTASNVTVTAEVATRIGGTPTGEHAADYEIAD